MIPIEELCTANHAAKGRSEAENAGPAVNAEHQTLHLAFIDHRELGVINLTPRF